jgi:cytochrome P450
VAALRAVRDYRRDPIPTLETLAQQYGDVVSVNLPGARVWLLNEPSLVHHVLVRNHENYRKTSGSGNTRRFFGNAMQLNNGAAARTMRRMLAPLFQFERVAATWSGVIIEETEAAMRDWGPGRRPGLTRELMDLTLAVAVRMFFGTAPGEETARLGRLYLGAASALGNFMLPAWVPTARNRRYASGVAALDAEIFARIALQRQAGSGGSDVLSALARLEGDDATRPTDAQIRNELISLMAASYFTLGVALNQSLRLLAEHAPAQAAVAAEAAAAKDDVHRLLYTGMVVKEALRLCPPAGLFVRDADANDRLGEWVLPAGTRIFLPAWLVQRDARFHPEPLAFRPERWTAEYEHALPPCAYFPFGSGPRGCIGSLLTEVLLRLMIATIVGRYRLEATRVTPAGASTWPEVEAAGGVQVTMHRR